MQRIGLKRERERENEADITDKLSPPSSTFQRKISPEPIAGVCAEKNGQIVGVGMCFEFILSVQLG